MAEDEHPEIDQLVAFQEERLGPDERDRIRQHVAECSRCTRELSELAVFDHAVDSDLPSLGPKPEHVAQDWDSFERQLHSKERPVDAAPGRSEPPAAVGRPPGRRWLLAVAASVAVVALGVLPFLGGSSSDSAVGRHPLFIDLIPDGENVRRASPNNDIHLLPETDLLVLRLHFGDLASYESYRVEVLDEGGVVRWKRGDLTRQPAGQILLLIPRGAFPLGRLVVRLWARSEPGESVLAEYSLTLHDRSE